MKFSIVIPAYNESATLAEVLKSLHHDLKQVEESFEIIVVDNGSTDSTPVVLSALQKELPELKTTRVFPNQGYGNGILAGLKIAQGDIVGWMHADSQVTAQDLITIYQKMNREGLDLCKAIRQTRDESFWRIVQSKIFNTVFRLLFHGRVHDINATPKLFRHTLYDRIGLTSKDWFIDPEVVIKAIAAHATIGEVPVIWQSRKGGKSKVALTTGLEFLKNMIRYKWNSHV